MSSLRCRATAATGVRPRTGACGLPVWVIHLILGLAPLGVAQASDSPLAQACAPWKPQETPAPTTPSAARLAECALQERRYEEAAQRYQALLAENDHPIFHAELGRAYLGLQDFERARIEFLQALATNLPPQARALLQMFLQMSEQQRTQAKSWMATLSWGLMHDSNSNQGPRSDQVELFGLPFTLNADGLPRASPAGLANLSVVHNATLQTDWLWQSNLNGALTRYSRNHAMDLGNVALDTGPRWALPGQGNSIYVPVGYSRTELDGQHYVDASTITPQWVRQLGLSDQALVSVMLARSRYPQNDARSAVGRSASLGWRHLIAGRWTLEGSVRQGQEDARDSAYSHQLRGVTLGLSGSPAEGWRVGGQLGWAQYRYRDAEVWASAARRDVRVNAGWQLARAFPGGYYLSLSGTLARTQSNLALYSSLRRQTQATVSKTF
ncbi:porin family protein [Curvibacter sp. HBC28]|uniref:Porin family protein n=1 Tax=Curvibacter microcysteis TaxID=3026419 RepID=A0ABT5MHB0_9BURK|nr:porin family protein [Curvibacter sp. HBC28]MDD0815964.1 porin family protein [Curvibacter sp. HBC28]